MVASHPSELMILRHAEAGNGSAAATDAERALTPRGRQDATRQGAWLSSSGFHPDAILASPARRAAQTTELVRAALGEQAPAVSWNAALYLAPLPLLLKALGRLPGHAAQVLLIGHNPGLHALVEHLSGQPLNMAPWGREFPTASLAHVLLPQGFQALKPGCGELALLRPAQGSDGWS